MFAYQDDEEDGDDEIYDDDQPQGYQALLDPDDEESFTMEDDENENDEELELVQDVDDDDDDDDDQAPTTTDNEIKPFSCTLCSASFSKFDVYREHFVSSGHRYKRRDEKRRLGEGSAIETSPVETFVNLLLFNKVPFESIQINVQHIEFCVSGSLEYNNTKYEHQHAPSLNDLYQILVDKLNQDYEKHQWKMPPQSFFTARDTTRKEVENVWMVARYCDDTGKSDEQIIKEVVNYCVYANVEVERERLIAHSIQTWRMFHRQETKPGFWCDICKQCFRKRKAIICHFETSEKHENNLKHLPPYRRAVQHSLFTGRLLNEFVPVDKLDYFRARVNAYRIPPSNKSIKNAYYCTFCKKSFESAHTLEKHLGWKGHRDLLRKRRQNDLDNVSRLVTYLNFNQLSQDQRTGGIQQMAKTPDEYRFKYNLEPVTAESIQEDIKRFDAQLAQQVMQNIHNQPGITNNFNRFQHGNNRGRGRGRGRASSRGQTFRPQGTFYQPRGQSFEQFNPPTQYQPRFFNNNNQTHQFYPQNNYGPPATFRSPNQNFRPNNNKRPYQQNSNNNYYNQRQSWPNKRPRFDRPPPPPYQPQLSSSNRIDYRYIANQNTYQQEQQKYFP